VAMGRLQSILIAAAPLASLVVPGPARACEPIGEIAHTVIASMQATDQTPPTLPALPPAEVHRSDGSNQGGCGASSCRDVGIISIAALATDDMTQRERIGYRFTLESGTLPASLALPTTAIQGTTLWWGADTGEEPIDVTLRVVAIDLAGNESAPQTVRVIDDPGGAGPAVLFVAALLLATRRRLEPRRSP
jgi:hypothetical protein